jgi:hypothetical protein
MTLTLFASKSVKGNLIISMMWMDLNQCRKALPQLNPTLLSRVSTPTIRALMKTNDQFTHLQSPQPLLHTIHEASMVAMGRISHDIDHHLRLTTRLYDRVSTEHGLALIGFAPQWTGSCFQFRLPINSSRSCEEVLSSSFLQSHSRDA